MLTVIGDEEVAVNLNPHDEIEIDGLWWTVTAHSVDLGKAAPVSMQLRSCEDPEFISALLTNPNQRFKYRRSV